MPCYICNMRTTVCRREHFNAAHRLSNASWSEEENRRFYGKCASKNFHGHNYELIVKLTGTVNPETGYLVDMKQVSEVVSEEILERYDHTNLNLDHEEFAATIPSTENFAATIWNRLRRKFAKEYDLAVVLYETPNNYVEYHGD